MNILIRLDASAQIGLGHWMRCQALKQVLAQQGHQVLFLVGREASGLVDTKENEMIWLEHPLDLEYVKHVVDKLPMELDWLVVDHYGLDHRFETAMRKWTPRIMVIDDLANRRHDCEILLDQNFYLQPEARYRGLIPAEAKCFLGPRFALLRKQFFEYSGSAVFPKKPEKLLINFGGSDPGGMTLRVLDAVQEQKNPFAIYCVAGQANPLKHQIEQFCKQNSNTLFFPYVSNMAKMMSQVDLAIGAGGSSHWERMYMGLPAIVVAIAQNQIESSQDLDSVNVIQYLGTDHATNKESIQNALQRLCTSEEMLRKMSQNGLNLIGDRTIRRYDELIANMSKA